MPIIFLELPALHQMKLFRRITFGQEILKVLACSDCLLILSSLLYFVGISRVNVELKRFGHPRLDNRARRFILDIVIFIFYSIRFLDSFTKFRHEIVELCHGFILTMLRVFHRVKELLALNLEIAELCLNVDISLI